MGFPRWGGVQGPPTTEHCRADEADEGALGPQVQGPARLISTSLLSPPLAVGVSSWNGSSFSRSFLWPLTCSATHTSFLPCPHMKGCLGIILGHIHRLCQDPGAEPLVGSALGSHQSSCFLLHSLPCASLPWSGTPGRWLKIRCGENIYTTESGSCYRSGASLFASSEPVVKHLSLRPCLPFQPLSLGAALCLEDAFWFKVPTANGEGQEGNHRMSSSRLSLGLVNGQ